MLGNEKWEMRKESYIVNDNVLGKRDYKENISVQICLRCAENNQI